MLSTLAKHRYQLGLLIALIAALAVFVPAGFTQDPQNPPDASQDQNRIETPADKSPDQTPAGNSKSADQIQNTTGQIDLDHLENYLGQQVTLKGDIDKIFGAAAFQMEAKDKGKDHILVINLKPESVHPEGDMKESKPVTATGTIRKFDSAEMKQHYPSLDLGSAPVAKFEGKPVLILGEREFEATLQPKTAEVAVASIEREKPSVAEPVPPAEPAPTPEPQVTTPAPAPSTPPPAASEPTSERRLPRTASPLVALALSGLLSLATGLGIRFGRS